MQSYAADLAAVRAAALRIHGRCHRTPVLTCATLDSMAGRRLFFKCENLQKVGAFKYRGATNAIRRLSDAEASRGVVTHSSGNHAQAVALAGRDRGIPAYIVMPSNAPVVKRRAVEGYGARVIECGPALTDREGTAARVREETGAAFVPPYDHPDVIAGQGTAALELLEEVPDLDAVIVPVGGGGLISGTTLACRELRPALRVFGAEPVLADDAAQSRALGRRLPPFPPRSVADGLLSALGELTWPVVRDLVHDVVTVDDDAIVAAMRLLWERAKLVVEPSGAAGLAVVLGSAFRALPGLPRVGLILSGGNVDLDALPWLSRGV